MWSEGHGDSVLHSTTTPPTDRGISPLGQEGAGVGVAVVVVDGCISSSESFDKPGGQERHQGGVTSSFWNSGTLMRIKCTQW